MGEPEPPVPVIVDLEPESERPFVFRFATGYGPVEVRLTRTEADRHTAQMVDLLDLVDAAAGIAQCSGRPQ